MIHEYFMETIRKETPSYSTGKKWAAEFNRGRVLRMMDWSGRQKDATADENVKVVHTLAMCDRRRDLQSIASEVSIISFWVVQSILTKILGISKVSARREPRMLTDDQKRTQLDIYKYLLSCYEDNPGNFIERVVTRDETWVHHFDPESKMQSKQKEAPWLIPS